MIVLRNMQRKVSLDIPKIKNQIQTLLDALDYSEYDIGLLFVSLKRMRSYNYIYRQQDKSTDILSFPYYPELKPGQRIQAKYSDEKNLGDIIIAPLYVQQDLARWNQTFDERMNVLVVHGICHLIGYDHIEDADYKIMKKKEAELLAVL